MTQYNSNFHDTQPFSDTCFQVSLAANVNQTYTVPGTSIQKYQAIFGYAENSNVYVGFNVTATTPTAGTSTSSANIEFKPHKKYVKGGDVLSFISGDTAGANAGVSLLQLPS